MARTEHLPIYKASYDLCLYLEHVVHGFSRAGFAVCIFAARSDRGSRSFGSRRLSQRWARAGRADRPGLICQPPARQRPAWSPNE